MERSDAEPRPPDTASRSSTIAIRLWREEGAPDRIRARVVRVLDDGTPVGALVATSLGGIDEVLVAVTAWLGEFRRGEEPIRSGPFGVVGREHRPDELSHSVRRPRVPELGG